MERLIGEQFEYSGVTLEVVENSSCIGCYFYDGGISCSVYNDDSIEDCGPNRRSDGKSVIFKKVE